MAIHSPHLSASKALPNPQFISIFSSLFDLKSKITLHFLLIRFESRWKVSWKWRFSPHFQPRIPPSTAPSIPSKAKRVRLAIEGFFLLLPCTHCSCRQPFSFLTSHFRRSPDQISRWSVQAKDQAKPRERDHCLPVCVVYTRHSNQHSPAFSRPDVTIGWGNTTC